MLKKIKLIPVILFFSLLPTVLFTSCDKDTNCYLEVLVTDAGTKKPKSNVLIDVKQERGTLKASGITDKTGKYTTHFAAPAIVIVKADLPVEGGHRRAEMTVRLLEGETVTADIMLPINITN